MSVPPQAGDQNGNKLDKTSLIDLSQSQFIHVSGPVRKETGGAGGTYATSRFASTEPAPPPNSHKKREAFDFLQHVISIFLILTVVLILIYVVIKI